MDYSVYRSLNDYAFDHSRVGDVAQLIANDAQFLFVALLAALFLATGRWRSIGGRRAVVGAGLSAGLALAIAQVIGHLWDRPRPYEAHASAHLLLSASPDPSFPSDHAIAAFAIATAIILRHRKAGILAMVMAVVLCVARVAAGTHYPSDVLGGALLGSAAAVLLWLPPIGPRLDALADRLGELYEAILARVLRRPAPAG
jgi:undecaprenyl-diphosphatase